MSSQDNNKDKEKAEAMDKVSKGLFAPAYPAIAEKIVKTLKVQEGKCIDAGAGPGMLAISLAKTTGLDIDLLELSEYSGAFAKKNISEAGLENRCRYVHGNVEKMPFEDLYADLIVSRGSIFFWNDLKAAFHEILRVLKPGGATFIGGGFGNGEVRDMICAQMAKDDPEWEKGNAEGKKKTVENRLRIITALEEEEIPYESISDDSGFWIIIKK
ncbi:ubiquinone/menaquinone biosynthesis C-methylase UbiE [Methanomicrobium sp. W14]|uniref:class I SAM-dependent methyltransferase n=1 Tax=Methanomicrobium sp. W14 TaxID=2817839 RepID=UPI001AE8B37A|nr:class I SAM-dependent methyltransferase [Methanomicrobium sp. W14]MBP2134369.1 ubiquinone/menaquinone biosynthesis C-methylase UbiE [Methanomicrobium sp. W14]